jgi:WD40 repeat protein
VHSLPVRDVQFRPDGLVLATASWDGFVHQWRVPDGLLLGSLPRQAGGVEAASFDQTGRRLLTASVGIDDHDDGEAQLWEPSAARPLTPPMVHPGRVTHALLSLDGYTVLTATIGGQIRAWDGRTGEALTPGLVCRESVIAADLAADGRTFAAGFEGCARIWHISPDSRPTDLLISVAELVSGQRAGMQGLVRLDGGEIRALAEKLAANDRDR